MENGKRLRIDAWRTRTAYLLLRRQLLYPDELKRRRVYSTVNAQFLQYAKQGLRQTILKKRKAGGTPNGLYLHNVKR